MPTSTYSRTVRRLAAAACVVVTACAAGGGGAAAQVPDAAPLPSARVIARLPNGSYRVEIGGRDTMLAISRDAARRALQMEADLQAARQEIVAKDSLLAHYARATAALDTVRARNRTYITELEAQLRGYQRLAEGYRNLSQRGSWLSIQGGLGATGDSRPALLAGIGIRQLRAWAFLQEQNQGGFLGVNFPLF
jgi:hypothetical protein